MRQKAGLLHPDGHYVRTLGDISEMREWFLKLLDTNGVSLQPGSYLAQMTEDLAEYGAFMRGEVQFVDSGRMQRVLTNAHSLIRIVFALRSESLSPRFRLEAMRLKLFRKQADLALYRPGENAKPRNQAWELLVGAACEATRPGAFFDEPDVCWSTGGIRWGMACKVFYPGVKNARRARENTILAGVKQIEGSDWCDRGMVFVNVTDLIDHSKFLIVESDASKHRAWPRAADVAALLREDIARTCRVVNNASLFRRASWDGRRRRPRLKAQCVVFHAATVAWAAGAPCEVTQSTVMSLRADSGDSERWAHMVAKQFGT
jgi:hypothetical protein